MKNNRNILWGVGFLVIAGVIGFGYYRWIGRIPCCEPPIEILEMQTEGVPVSAWVGHWDFYQQDNQGYSQGVVLRLEQDGEQLVGDYDAVWSFPGAPAARLNNGVLSSVSTGGENIVLRWEGSREDSGEAILRLSKDGQELVWKGIPNDGAVGDEFSLEGERIFYRNQWVAWAPTEQAQFLQTIKDLLKTEGSGYVIQPGEDATIMVTGNYAVVNAFVPNAPDEESGWVYLKKNGEEWAIVLGPKVRFNKTELDQAGIPEVMRY